MHVDENFTQATIFVLFKFGALYGQRPPFEYSPVDDRGDDGNEQVSLYNSAISATA